MKVLKGRFKTINDNHFGLFCVQFNDDAGFIESYDIVATADSSTWENLPTQGYLTILQTIQDIKMKGSFIQTMTKDMHNSLASVAQDESFFGELYKYICDGNKEQIKFVLKNLFYRIISSKEAELLIETDIEGVREERPSGSVGLGDIDGDGSAPSSLPEGEYVNIKLMLSPIRGKYIVDLLPGDTIMVRIDSTTPRGSALIDKLGLKDGSDIKPAPAKIVQVNLTDAGREIVVAIDEGIFGKTIEEERVKVAVHNPSSQKMQQSLRIEKAEEPAKAAEPRRLFGGGEGKPSVDRGTLTLVLLAGLTFLTGVLIYVLVSLD